jgi:ATP/ADP translocase
VSAVKVIQQIGATIVALVAIVVVVAGALALFGFTLYITANPH